MLGLWNTSAAGSAEKPFGMLARAAGLAVAAAVVAGGFAGCTSYTNLPTPDNALAGEDPNTRQVSAVTLEALRWTVRRHPMPGPYLLNLPAGTSTETAERFAMTLGRGATVPDGTNMSSLPVYHVTRVWTRVSDAKVDIIYPVRAANGGWTEGRGVTAWLTGGLSPWSVDRGQYWEPGTVPTPQEIWVPIPQAQLDAIARAERDAQRAAEAAERAARRAEQSDAKRDAMANTEDRPAPDTKKTPPTDPDTAPAGDGD